MTKRQIKACVVVFALCALGAGTYLLTPNESIGADQAKIPKAAKSWVNEWPKTDFSRHSVDLGKIRSGGPPKDGIPPIDDPRFLPLDKISDHIGTEPVISISIKGDSRAYPLSVLMWHEIVNDYVGGVPVSITFCPLCNASVVFDRRLDGQVLDFGTTGKLRRSDLVMYDRQTESWWQQFLGEGIVGTYMGKRLKMLPSRLESLNRFRTRHPDGKVLVPNNPSMRNYGANPYAGYDSLSRPWLYGGKMPADVAPLSRVVSIGKEAWALALVRRHKRIVAGDHVITWEAGQNSALDSPEIAKGRDVGNVVVQKRTASGLVDAVYGIDFAFAFYAFHPDGIIHAK
ncbi:MAG: DUF3179 domain-containing protein [Rhodospirillales bacterium]|jgi:hypothetical protein|nr:DUF3179 domain-containing protein [Rhodospirillales bacterium]MBT4006169.1 DUF3179 domain-containing protein [Rhodospirillales bacterium]MBT5075831.1 DUF3179 domain-containing protein [Rhodospirillales bacterium]MBT5114350.1 DUF3179 domain-containing protein [Rhodospirillales bacterium]MBT5672742.1 DUF3179 domain-containing protein [Rhodospirillales bacterium]